MFLKKKKKEYIYTTLLQCPPLVLNAVLYYINFGNKHFANSIKIFNRIEEKKILIGKSIFFENVPRHMLN